jgi:histidinol-phosphate aminotransferase
MSAPKRSRKPAKEIITRTLATAPRYEMSRFTLDRQKYVLMDDNSVPFPPPVEIMDAIQRLELNRYPNLTAVSLREKLGEYMSVPPENILIANGSMEIIDVINRTFVEPKDEVVIPIPSYTPYMTRPPLHGGRPVFVKPRAGFAWNIEDIRKAITRKTKFIVICNPNNPTGVVCDEGFLEALADEGKILIIDEAYAEFCQQNPVKDYQKLTSAGNVVVTRTFSKAFGLAGLRVGYMSATPELIEYFYQVKMPLSASLVAQAGALAALLHPEHMRQNVANITKGRDFLMAGLKTIDGLKPFPSAANFILIRILKSSINSTGVFQTMKDKYGILVRDMKDFRGLSDRFFRITVGRMEDNERCLSAVREIMVA